MRDALTALATSVILLLAAALLVPPLVDWRGWRGDIDTRLGLALGQDVVSHGLVSLTLLPHPQLSLGGITIGAGVDGAQPLARIGRLDLALSLPALIKGEIRILSSAADQVDLVLTHDAQGRLVLPRARLNQAGLDARLDARLGDIALDQVSLSRGRLLLQPVAGGPPRVIAPIAASLSAPSLSGPWKIEAEIAGQPLRLVTGAYEAAKGLPFKLASSLPERRAEMEGHLAYESVSGVVSPSWSGQASLAMKAPPLAEGEDAAASTGLTATLRGGLAHGQIDIAALTLELGSAGRLEGKGTWNMAAGEPARVELGSRRLNGEALVALVAALRQGDTTLDDFWKALAQSGLMAELALSADQISWRGEEMTQARGQVRLAGGSATLTRGQAQFAGITLGIAGDAALFDSQSRAHVTAKAPSLQRAALALARLGLRPEAADALSRLGEVDVSLAASLRGDRLVVNDIALITAIGRVDGSASVSAGAFGATLVASGMDLSGLATLAPALMQAGTAALPGRITLDFTATDARFGTSPPGSLRLAAMLGGTDLPDAPAAWRITEFEASGFGGLALKTLPPDGSGRILANLSAPDAAPVLTLAGLALEGLAFTSLALPESQRRILGRALGQRAAGLSPLALTMTFDPQTGPKSWQVSGQAGLAQHIEINGEMADGVPVVGNALATGQTGELLKLLDPALADLAPWLPVLLSGRSTFGYAAKKHASAQNLWPEVYWQGADVRAAWQIMPVATASSRMATALFAGPFSLASDGEKPVALNGQLSLREDGFDLSGLTFSSEEIVLTGALRHSRNGALEGELSATGLTPAMILGLGLGAAPSDAAGGWAGQRFADVPNWPLTRIQLSGPALDTAIGIATNWQALLIRDETVLRLENITATLQGGDLRGALRLGHEGALRSLGWQLELKNADAALLTQSRLSGRASIMLDGGASGETPLRLVSGMSGTGQARLTDAVFHRLSPVALDTAMAEGAAKGSHSDLAQAFRAALGAGDWPLGNVSAPLTLTSGILRAGPVTTPSPAASLTWSGAYHFRTGLADVLGVIASGTAGLQRGEATAQARLLWRGPPGAMQQELDITGIRNLLATQELKRELERIDAFQADLRERAFFARRLKQERDAESREKQAARDEALRLMGRGGGAVFAPSPTAPMSILPVP